MHRVFFRSLPLLPLIWVLGCAPEETCGAREVLDENGVCVVPEVCGGHGHLHGTECHCDGGYVLEGDTCVEDPGHEGDHGSECGGHGHLEGEACHCDEGYIVEGDTCVEDPHHGHEEACGGHGHLEGDACHCDDGYVAEGDTCVAG